MVTSLSYHGTSWRLVPGVSLPSPCVSWDGLQQNPREARAPEGMGVENGWMDVHEVRQILALQLGGCDSFKVTGCPIVTSLHGTCWPFISRGRRGRGALACGTQRKHPTWTVGIMKTIPPCDSALHPCLQEKVPEGTCAVLSELVSLSDHPARINWRWAATLPHSVQLVAVLHHWNWLPAVTKLAEEEKEEVEREGF